MNQQTREKANEAISKAQKILQSLNLSQFEDELKELQAQTYQSDFWQRQDAQEIMQQTAQLQAKISQISAADQQTQDIQAMLDGPHFFTADRKSTSYLFRCGQSS